MAAQILAQEKFGFNSELLQVIEGGFVAWEEAGLPLETSLAVKPKGKSLTLWGRLKRGH